MSNKPESHPWETLRLLAEAGDRQRLQGFLDSLAPSEAVRAMFRLDRDEQDMVLTTLSPSEAADLIEEIPDEHAADMIERLEPDDAAAILTEMDSDDQADVLREMDHDDAQAVLDKMEPKVAEKASALLLYDDDVAGGLMITEHVALRENSTAGDAIESLGRFADSDAEYKAQHVFVVSALGSLIGIIPLNDLVLARRTTTLAEIMSVSPHVSAQSKLDDLHAFFERNELIAVPVIDDRVRLLGVVTRQAVDEALSERAEEEHRKVQGIIGGDELRTMPVLTRSGRRLAWLSINIVLNAIAASVIAFYEDTLSAVIALAVFLPIVSDMSGCSGNQAVAVSMRELSLGIVKPFEVARVWLQEASVGLINGACLGFMLGLGAWWWKGNPYLGIVVGTALAVNSLVAVSIGGTVPLILKRIGVDPAVASGPILTTVTDMCGFFLVLSFAAAMLPLLVP